MMVVHNLPIRGSVAIAKAIDYLVTAYGQRAGYTGTIVADVVVDSNIYHLMIHWPQHGRRSADITQYRGKIIYNLNNLHMLGVITAVVCKRPCAGDGQIADATSRSFHIGVSGVECWIAVVGFINNVAGN